MARILIVTSLAESLLNFRGDLIAAMMREGHEVITCAPDCDDALKARFTAARIDFRVIPMQRATVAPLGDLKTFFAVRRMIGVVKPDIVFAYTVKPVVYGLLAAQTMGIRRRYGAITGLGYAFTETTEFSLKRWTLSVVLKTLYWLALRGATGVFFENPDDRAFFQNNRLTGRATPLHLVNGVGVNIAHFTPVPLPQDVRFLMIARILADKGVREYAEAARAVKTAFPEAVCDLVGPFDTNPSAVQPREVEAWVAEGIIHYHGATSDVRPPLASTSVYVLPSYREGTPRTVLEAMAMGRPIITTDTPGCRETVRPGDNGFLVPVQDAVSLAEAMKKLAADAELRARMGQRSLEICREKYDVNLVNRQVLGAMGLLKAA